MKWWRERGRENERWKRAKDQSNLSFQVFFSTLLVIFLNDSLQVIYFKKDEDDFMGEREKCWRWREIFEGERKEIFGRLVLSCVLQFHKKRKRKNTSFKRRGSPLLIFLSLLPLTPLKNIWESKEPKREKLLKELAIKSKKKKSKCFGLFLRRKRNKMKRFVERES